MAWLNNDGLYVKFGTEEGVAGTAGEYTTRGPTRLTEVLLTGTALGTAAAIQDDHTVIPAGARIEKVEVIAQTAMTSGGSATLNVGFSRLDRSTELDYDGLLAAFPLASMNAVGETNSLTNGSSGAGVLVGTVLANAGLLTADYDTAAFTGGTVKVRIHWSV